MWARTWPASRSSAASTSPGSSGGGSRSSASRSAREPVRIGGSSRRRIAATGRACRAVVATRLLDAPREHEAFRALQLGMFTGALVLDEAADIALALERVPGLDVRAIVDALDDPEVERAYEADRAEARTAA